MGLCVYIHIYMYIYIDIYNLSRQLVMHHNPFSNNFWGFLTSGKNGYKQKIFCRGILTKMTRSPWHAKLERRTAFLSWDSILDSFTKYKHQHYLMRNGPYLGADEKEKCFTLITFSMRSLSSQSDQDIIRWFKHLLDQSAKDKLILLTLI